MLFTVTPPVSLHAEKVRTVKLAGPDFDTYTANPTLVQQQWMRDNFWRIQSYTPYFDTKTSWYANSWFYYDSYAIYRGSALASQHPEWILKDQSGNQLYIQYDCSGGTCPQYAADIGNPAFRDWWISTVIGVLNKGYRGLWIDDVNLEFRVSNGNGTFVAPWDPRTNSVMTYDNWRRYFAEFMEQVKARVPASAYCSGGPCEITHNSIWYASPTRTADPYVQREIAATDFVNIERSVNDDGLTGGTGSWSVGALFDFIDTVHSAGKAVNLMDYSMPNEPGKLEYGLAGYFLISTGKDTMTATGTPDNWWVGYTVDPGTPLGPRYKWNGLWRRDFTGGMVLLNEPGAGTISVTLPGNFTNLSGGTINGITLGTKQGAVLRGLADVTPPVLSSISAASTQTGATISWTTNELSDTQVEYGTTVGYGLSTAVATSLIANHQATLTSLAAGTLYHFRVRSRDAAGNLAISGDATFTTAAAVSTPVAPGGSVGNGGTFYPSDLPWTSVTNGWGPAERNLSNGETGSGDGRTLSLNTIKYTKGLGVHAASTVRISLANAGCSVFTATVGVDDEVPAGLGSVVFQVWGDTTKLYESARLVSGGKAVPISVNVAGRNDLVLTVTDAGDGNGYDHADWANAQLTCTSAPGAAVTKYVSDLTWTSMANGWGPAELNRSNGENIAGDGRTITLNGVTFPKGLGVHAGSNIHYAIGGTCSVFAATVGVDDEMKAGLGSVIFQVWGDGVKLYESSRLVSGNTPVPVSVNVSARKDLALIVTDAGDGPSFDHADWANARLTCSQ